MNKKENPINVLFGEWYNEQLSTTELEDEIIKCVDQLINSVKKECAKKCNPYVESSNAFIKGTAKSIAKAIKEVK